MKSMAPAYIKMSMYFSGILYDKKKVAHNCEVKDK